MPPLLSAAASFRGDNVLTRPLLIEAGTTESLRSALRECRERRHRTVSFVVNIVLVFGLGFVIWTVLAYKHHHRVDPDVRFRQAQVAQGNLFARLGRHDRQMNNRAGW